LRKRRTQKQIYEIFSSHSFSFSIVTVFPRFVEKRPLPAERLP